MRCGLWRLAARTEQLPLASPQLGARIPWRRERSLAFAMQKVVGSSPIIRSVKPPEIGGFLSFLRQHESLMSPKVLAQTGDSRPPLARPEVGRCRRDLRDARSVHSTRWTVGNTEGPGTWSELTERGGEGMVV